MLTEEQMRDALRQCPHDTVENLRVRWLCAKDFARAIESAACEERDARIAELTRELEEAREVLKETGLLLHHFWCDVQMNEYSFDKLNNGMEAIDAAIKEQT